MSGIRYTIAVASRDLRRLRRRPGQVIASVLTPLMLWALLATSLSGAFNTQSSWTYLLVGATLLAVVFSSVFSCMSLIEDREEGVARALLIAPGSRLALASGKTLGASLVAIAQAAALLIAGAIATNTPLSGLVTALLAVALVSIGASGFGLTAAWKSGSARSFHGLVNLVIMPAWALSGAVYPVADASRTLQIIAAGNPLGWVHTVIADSLAVLDTPPEPNTVAFRLVALTLFAALGVTAAAAAFNEPNRPSATPDT